ncbi:MAG: hypothetical protein ACFB0D_19530 [Phormidesmis sp.]
MNSAIPFWIKSARSKANFVSGHAEVTTYRSNMLRSFPRKSKKRSPLKDKPLRNPGQSLDEAIDRLMEDDVLTLVATASGCAASALQEWFRWYFNVPPRPVLITVFCSLLFAYCFFRLLGLRQKLKTLKMARDGERAGGQYLDRL